MVPRGDHELLGAQRDARHALCGVRHDRTPSKRRLDVRYVYTEQGLAPLAGSDQILVEALDVFGGDLTCCRLGHKRPTGAAAHGDRGFATLDCLPIVDTLYPAVLLIRIRIDPPLVKFP